MILEIADSNGVVVDRIDGATSKGLHRTTWNLRYAPFSVSSGGGGRRRFGGGGFGVPVAPGSYTVTAYQRTGDTTTALGEPVPFEVQAVMSPTLPAADRQQVIDFQMEVGALQQAVSPLQVTIGESLDSVAEIKTVIRDGRRAPLALLDQARQVELKLLEARDKLSGDPTRAERNENSPPSITSRMSNALFGTLGHSHGPTETHRQQFQIAREEFAEVSDGVRAVIEEDFEALKTALDEAGVPWTRGRKLPALDRIPGN